MLLNILKWVGIGVLFIFLLSFLKEVIIFLFYVYNKNYREKVDFDNATKIIEEQKRQEVEKENRRLDELEMLTSQWTNVANYYYHYYEKGQVISDYALMLDLLTPKIITLLGGNYDVFRKQMKEAIDSKEAVDKTKETLAKQNEKIDFSKASMKDFEKCNLTEDDINKILDAWEKRNKKERDDGQSKDNA